MNLDIIMLPPNTEINILPEGSKNPFIDQHLFKAYLSSALYLNEMDFKTPILLKDEIDVVSQPSYSSATNTAKPNPSHIIIIGSQNDLKTYRTDSYSNRIVFNLHPGTNIQLANDIKVTVMNKMIAYVNNGTIIRVCENTNFMYIRRNDFDKMTEFKIVNCFMVREPFNATFLKTF